MHGKKGRPGPASLAHPVHEAAAEAEGVIVGNAEPWLAHVPGTTITPRTETHAREEPDYTRYALSSSS
jgi:hypothetical protein